MSDERVATEETGAEVEPEGVDPVQPDPDDPAAQLSPTRCSRIRPNALDLQGAFDESKA